MTSALGLSEKSLPLTAEADQGKRKLLDPAEESLQRVDLLQVKMPDDFHPWSVLRAE
jgi:hypothetical protein